MSERQEPTIKLTPDDDDIASYRSGSESAAVEDYDGGGGGALWMVLLGLAVLLLSGGFFLVYQQQEADKQMMAEQLTQYQERIEKLDRRLALFDENVSESESATKNVLNELDTEIRKLWDNVWKKSKERLAEHDKSIKTLQSQIASQKSDQASLKKALAEAESARETLRAELVAMKAEVGEFSSQFARFESKMGDQLKTLPDDIRSLKKGQNTLDVKVKEHGEAFDSINAFRRQVLREMRVLRDAVAELQEQSGGA